jgi:hypothetical protein
MAFHSQSEAHEEDQHLLLGLDLGQLLIERLEGRQRLGLKPAVAGIAEEVHEQRAGLAYCQRLLRCFLWIRHLARPSAPGTTLAGTLLLSACWSSI